MIAMGWLFREPTTINYPFEKGPLSPVSRIFRTHRRRRTPFSRRDSVVNMLYVDTRLAKNVASHANFARPFVQLKSVCDADGIRIARMSL